MTATNSAILIAQAPRRLGRLIFSQRFLPLWLTAGLIWLIFSLCRLLLVLCSLDVLDGLGPGTVLRCFGVGMLYDTAPVGYALLPLTLALLLAGADVFAREGFRRAVTAYVATIVVLQIVVESIGIGFFLHFGRRLNYVALTYLEHWREVGTYVWNNYPAWLLVVGPAIVYYAAFRLLYLAFWRGQRPRGAAWGRALLAVVLTGLCVLACRGGFQRDPLRLDRAYFSDNEALCQLGLNNFFTLFYASRSVLEDDSIAAPDYPLPPAAQSERVAAGLLLTDTDEPLAAWPYPLARRSRGQGPPADYNVVLILMEGMAGQPVGALGHAPSQTPSLDALCREGLFFDHVFAVGERTCNGVTGVLCGHPDLGERSVLKGPRSQGEFLTLPGVLRGRGYRTVFLYGGNPDFDNMRGFLTANRAIERFVGQEDLVGPKGHPGNWGVPDEVLFRAVNQTLEEMAGQRFFAFVLTTSNHEPYEAPPGKVELLPPITEDNRRLNAYRYADWALGEFFRLARQSSYFDKTIFVLISDHGRGLDRSKMFDVPGYRIPLLIYAPGLVPPGVVHTVGSQTDVPATILGLLGGPYEHCFLGRDLRSVRPGDGFALLNAGDRLAFVRRGRAVAISPRRDPRLFDLRDFSAEPVLPGQAGHDEAPALAREMLGFYGMAVAAYKDRLHRLPLPAPHLAGQ